MKILFTNFVILLILSTTLYTEECEAQWIRVHYSEPGTGAIYGIYFVNQNTGWITGKPGMIKKTTDGGYTWLNQSLNVNIELNNIYFSDANTGFIAGERCSIYKTSNGGLNWNLMYSDTTTSQMYFEDNYFVNSNTGFFVGAKILKTTNTGLSWIVQNHPFTSSIDFRSVNFINDQTGWTVNGYSPCKIVKTSNGGANWVIQASTGYHLQNIKFFNSTNGITIGTTSYSTDTTTLWKTLDGGNNWSVMSKIYASFRSSHFINELTGWIVTSVANLSRIYKTTDGGISWNYQTFGNNSFYSINFIDNNNGWIGGGNASFTNIYKTTNGGPVFVNQNNENTPTKYSLSQNYPNPFNPITNIKFNVAKMSDVKIVIYDVTGREVQTLVNESLKPGTYETSFDGGMLNSGVYFYKITAGEFSETNKMLLIK